MIFNKKRDMQYYMEKVIKQNHFGFKVNNRGILFANGVNEIRTFLAYKEGHWYGSCGDIAGTTDNLSEKGKHLFLISENKFWMMRNDGSVEYSSATKKLSEDAVVFLFAVQKQGLCLYVIDGHKNKAPMMTLMESDPQSICLAVTIITALVRQYDPKRADEMEEFWFEAKIAEETFGKSVEYLDYANQQDEEIQSDKIKEEKNIVLPWD